MGEIAGKREERVRATPGGKFFGGVIFYFAIAGAPSKSSLRHVEAEASELGQTNCFRLVCQ